MPEIRITQQEAEALIRMEKRRVDDEHCFFPSLGGSIRVPLISHDRREEFMLDITRGTIELKKCTFQNRARSVIVLVRLDIAGSPHRNPDDTEIPAPHLHLFREGYGDKWAIPVPVEDFPNLHDLYLCLDDFMRYCNITLKPFIDREIFA